MSYTYVLINDIGKLRLIIPDRVEASAIFQDEELTMFLTLESGLKRAAALALETIAADEALVQKVMTTQTGVQTNGAATAKALLERAARLRTQADEADEADEGGLFDIAEMPVDAFAERERLYKQWQRGAL